jgi:2-keto-4-pentenoate hydratase
MTGENSQLVEQAADRLWTAASTQRPCSPVRELIGSDDVALAYAVQEFNVGRRLKAGARAVGRKIGMTSVAVQTQLGYDQPNYGILFCDREVANGGEAPANRLMQPRAEAEIAFVLGRDLSGNELTIADVMRSVDYAVSAIEIVDSRIAGWDIRITDSIADNASCGMYALGTRPRRIVDLDLALCGMVARLNGQVASMGVGGASLGNPLLAALWLARTVASAGQKLMAGDIVLSGALGPIVPLSNGDLFEAEIDGLGSVRLTLPRLRSEG